MSPGDSVQIFDPDGKMIGTVSLFITKTGHRATGFDLPRAYGLKQVKPTTARKPVVEESWEVPEEASNGD